MIDGTGIYCPPFRPMADLVQPGEHGLARLGVVEIDEHTAALENLRHHGHFRAFPGRYAALHIEDGLMMSDAPSERITTEHVTRLAHGDVLILGLGVAMLPVALASNPQVRSITVVELYHGVIELLRPTLEAHAPGTRVLQGDAFLPETKGLPRAKEGGGFDLIWADIWPNICADHYPEHVALRRAWRPWLRPGGRHLTWVAQRVENAWRRERREVLADPWQRVHPTPSARVQAAEILAVRRRLSPRVRSHGEVDVP